MALLQLTLQEPMDTMVPETERENPVLSCALAGDVEGLKQLFEDPEDPTHEKVGQMLFEQDVVGRSPLFLACMLGRIEVIQEMAKHGVDLNQRTPRGYSPIHCAAAWGQLDTLSTMVELGADIVANNFRGEKARDVALRYRKTDCADFLELSEAKQVLELYITQIQQTITDSEKVHGRLNKEDKHTALKACEAKSEWIRNGKSPTVQDFVDQKIQLETTMTPIFNKLNAPREYRRKG
ncbi:hypothetical protein NDU88_005042 [Pleurodeles waltl]|uniref:Ankyrin repeat domain-containing protein 45 n=1 Tax=Pleurodeles waltl TaxID=8319 RepID=A0AAV7T9N5_PLEWA|nr:hypothetical protein NDU88_005042 [Pleurodeles waltl]